MIDSKHIPAIANSARAASQSVNAFIKATRDREPILLRDELEREYVDCRRVLQQRMIDAGCFEQEHRLPVFPLEGTVHAALLTLAAVVGVDDRLPQEIEVWASRLAAVVTALEEFLPAPPSEPPPAGRAATPAGLDAARFKHGPDFACCIWNGEQYTFTPAQRACVKVLWEAFENGTPEVGQAYILVTAGSESQRLQDLFKGSNAWKTMIVSGSTAGAFRLADPT